MSTPNKGGDVGVVVEKETKTRTKLQRPKLYKVLLHNDDYTTMEFVVMILMTIFSRTESEATAIMLHVHRTGVGVAGVYTHEIAEAKMKDLNANDVEAAMRMVEGSARSMGLEVVG